MRAAILATDDRPREEITVPWDTGGAPVFARALSIGSWQRWLVGNGNVTVTGKMMAEIVCESLVTEDGERIFQPSDSKALLERNSETVMEICAVVMRLSGLANEEDAGDVAEDFGQARSGATSSA